MVPLTYQHRQKKGRTTTPNVTLNIVYIKELLYMFCVLTRYCVLEEERN